MCPVGETRSKPDDQDHWVNSTKMEQFIKLNGVSLKEGKDGHLYGYVMCGTTANAHAQRWIHIAAEYSAEIPHQRWRRHATNSFCHDRLYPTKVSKQHPSWDEWVLSNLINWQKSFELSHKTTTGICKPLIHPLTPFVTCWLFLIDNIELTTLAAKLKQTKCLIQQSEHLKIEHSPISKLRESSLGSTG